MNGTPCDRCGFCCICNPCVLSLSMHGQCDCPELVWDGERYECKLAETYGDVLGIGEGCESHNPFRKCVRNRDHERRR